MATAQDTHKTSQQVQLHVEPPILQPASDQRSYRALTLGNGLRAVLIHDPQLTFAAACANVRCGYMLDPEQQPGLAHWLEHAVHLGSEPYPGTATYKQFLAKHGGTSNAATSECQQRPFFKASLALHRMTVLSTAQPPMSCSASEYP
jgi:insulysin